MAVATEYGKEALLLQSTAMNANEEALLLQSTAKSANVVFLTGGCGNRHAPEQRTSVGAAEHHPEELGSGYKVGDAVQPQAMASSFGIDGPQSMASSLCYDGKTYFGGARSATAATCDDDDEKDDDAAATGDDDADKPPVTWLIGGAVRDGGMEVLAYGEESDLLRACVDCGQVTCVALWKKANSVQDKISDCVLAWRLSRIICRGVPAGALSVSSFLFYIAIVLAVTGTS